MASAPEGLYEEVGAEATTTARALSGQVRLGAEAPAVTQASGTDPIALLQAGLDTEDLMLALYLREVELEFKTCLPEKIVVYLNEQKVELLSKAAVCADEFVLTHRVAFPSMHLE